MNMQEKVEAINEHGKVLFKKKKFSDALQSYQKCITLSKKHKLSNEILARSLANAAFAHLKLKEYEKCRSLCTECIELGDTGFICKVFSAYRKETPSWPL